MPILIFSSTKIKIKIIYQWHKTWTKRRVLKTVCVLSILCILGLVVSGFFLLPSLRALSPGDLRRARFISRFLNPLYEAKRVRYIGPRRGVSLHHLSTSNLPWNIMKHVIQRCVPATRTRSVKTAHRASCFRGRHGEGVSSASSLLRWPPRTIRCDENGVKASACKLFCN